MRRVVYGEEREEERYVIRSITFQDQVSVSFNRLNQRRSLKSSDQNALKHTVSHFLTIVLHCRRVVLMEAAVEENAEELGAGRPRRRAVRGGR